MQPQHIVALCNPPMQSLEARAKARAKGLGLGLGLVFEADFEFLPSMFTIAVDASGGIPSPSPSLQ